MTTTEARRDFAATLRRVRRGERVLLDRHGEPVAAIVSARDLALLEKLEDYFDRRAARKARAEADEQGTVPWDHLKSELGL